MNKSNNTKRNFAKWAKVVALTFAMAVMVGCESFVEVDQPVSQLTASAAFETAATAEAAITNNYARMRDTGLLKGSGQGISCLLGNYTDELEFYGADGIEPFYNNAITAADPGILDLWANAYSQVYAANAAIESLANSPIDQLTKDRLTGEALFMRALIHLNVGSLFGDCPYIKTTDYRENGHASRLPLALVYAECAADLERATELLPEEYIQPGRSRPNRAAAWALLARVYLYSGAWAEAANAASAVMNTNLYALEENAANVFLKDATSTIWQLTPESDGTNTQEGLLYIFEQGPPPAVALNPELVASFENGDTRRTQWVGTVTDGTSTWYYPYKYKEREGTASTVEASVQLRIEEQFLIRAEARARQGELIGAIEDINTIRLRAGLPISTATTTSELLDAVTQERRHELFTEGGHRFFDLKRLGLLDSVLGTKPGWDANDRLWPIPQSELLVNSNLAPQNPGY